MDYFAEAWAATGAIEKGYSNRPPDPETMHGITIAVARAHGYLGHMKDLPWAFATSIARASYWDTLRLDEIAQISPLIALELFDTNVNLWAGAAPKWLQVALNALNETWAAGAQPDLVVDEVIGTQTIKRLAALMKTRPNREVETIVLRTLNSLQCADYARQAGSDLSKRRFFAGWVLKRVSLGDNPEPPRV